MRNDITMCGSGNSPAARFVLHRHEPHLVLEDALVRWTPAGYATRLARPKDEQAEVILFLCKLAYLLVNSNACAKSSSEDALRRLTPFRRDRRELDRLPR